MTAPLLEVRGLTVEIRTAHATVRPVDGTGFAVAPGEMFGIVGESGCGKSMTLRSILGLLPPEASVVAGEVVFEGNDLLARTRATRSLRGRSVGMIFQEPMTALNPVMRVGDQVSEGPRTLLGFSRRKARERALELLRAVGIPDAARRMEAYPHELSGGLRQRVMIACALSCEPRLLLCDEPTTALDVTIQSEILELLSQLREQRGLTIVLVTHDLAVVAQTCSRLAVMYAGRVVETGAVADVFAQPRHPYTEALLAAVPDFDDPREVLQPMPGTPPDPAALPPGCVFEPRCRYAIPECSLRDVPLVGDGDERAAACIRTEVVGGVR